MKESSTVYVGLDVHKYSIDIAAANAGRDGEVWHVGNIGGDLVALDKALRKIVSRRPSPAGGLRGWTVRVRDWRHLTARGIACEIVAPSSIPKRSADRVNTHRRSTKPDAAASAPALAAEPAAVPA